MIERQRKRIYDAIWNAHKIAHGCVPDSEHWNDPRWQDGNEWEFKPEIIVDAIQKAGYALVPVAR